MYIERPFQISHPLLYQNSCYQSATLTWQAVIKWQTGSKFNKPSTKLLNHSTGTLRAWIGMEMNNNFFVNVSMLQYNKRSCKQNIGCKDKNLSMMAAAAICRAPVVKNLMIGMALTFYVHVLYVIIIMVDTSRSMVH